MTPAKFYAVNIPAILVWAPAHVLPGVLAVSALHEYAGLHHHGHVGKHIWILGVVGVAIIAGLAIWYRRRRPSGDIAAAKPPA
jgi:membrane-associated protein